MADWRDVDGWPYIVSDDGRVRRHPDYRCHRSHGGDIAQSPNPSGYLCVCLSDKPNGRLKRIPVHTLVCTAWHGPRPDGYQVRHIDGVRTHNTAKNLRWGAPAENRADMERHGTVVRGARNGKAAFSAEQVKYFRGRYRGHLAVRRLAGRKHSAAGFVGGLADEAGVTVTTMKRLLRGTSYVDCN